MWEAYQIKKGRSLVIFSIISMGRKNIKDDCDIKWLTGVGVPPEHVPCFNGHSAKTLGEAIFDKYIAPPQSIMRIADALRTAFR